MFALVRLLFNCFRPKAHGTHHDTTVFRATGYDVVIMWAEFDVQYGSSVTTDSGQGHINATRLKHKSMGGMSY